MAVTANPNADLPRLGIVLMLTAWLFFSLVDLGAKWLALAGVPAFQLAFMRYAGHFVISVGVIAKGGIDASRFKTDHPWQVISRALLLISATVFNFYALRFLPLTVVSAIMFSSPVIVCFLSVFVLKESVGPWRWAAIILGFLGVLVVVRPFGSAFHPTMLADRLQRHRFGFVLDHDAQAVRGCCRGHHAILPRAYRDRGPAALRHLVLGSAGKHVESDSPDQPWRLWLVRASTADERTSVR